MQKAKTLEIWIWAISKSNFRSCRVCFCPPIYFFADKDYSRIGIGLNPTWGFSIYIPYQVECHFYNQNNADFLRYYDDSDDIPF